MPPKLQFQAGGSLREDKYYVERAADQQLFEALRAGEPCYVLAPRQIGKTSLRIRTARKLKKAGFHCVGIDLLQFGTAGVTVDQWYRGLTDAIAEELELPLDIEAYWLRHGGVAAMRRLWLLLRDEVLADPQRQVIIFVDEIESVRALAFSADDFFAMVRSAGDERSSDPVWQRLTFCLIGVATPGELIQDPTRTPFNIGRAIYLEDFSPEEARTFLPGLTDLGHDPELLLGEILAWTAGHPYMTQRLCSELQRTPSKAALHEHVRNVVETNFLKRGGTPDADANLATAAKRLRDRKLYADTLRSQMLHLYRQLLQGVRIAAQDDDLGQLGLRLSGMVKRDGAELRVRNRIFALVFSEQWVQKEETDAFISEQLARWQETDKSAGYLLRGQALQKALAWAEQHPQLDPDVTAYLQAGQQLESEERRRKNLYRRRLRQSLALTLVPFLLLAASYWSAGPAPALQVGLAGCEEVGEGPTCELAENPKLTLWVETDWDARVTVRQGSTALSVDERQDGDGRRITVQPRSAPDSLTVSVGRWPRTRTWRLGLRPTNQLVAVWRLEVEHDRKLKLYARARQRLEEQLRNRPLPAELRAELTRLLATLAVEQDAAPEAKRLYREAIALDKKAGLISREMDDKLALSAILARVGETAEAATLARECLESSSFYVAPKMAAAYQLGMISARRGESFAALAALAQGARWAHRLNAETEEVGLAIAMNEILLDVGHLKEARTILAELQKTSHDSTSQIHILTALGESLLLEEERQHGSSHLQRAHTLAEVQAPLVEALALTATSQTPRLKGAVLLDLAQSSLLYEDVAQTHEWLSQAGAALAEKPDEELKMRAIALAGRLALREKSPKSALLRAAELSYLEKEHDHQEFQWQALSIAAEALDDDQRPAEALEKYRAAEELLTRRYLAGTSGRNRGWHERSTALYVDLLLRQGDRAQAFAVARRARLRFLGAWALKRSLAQLNGDERQRWDTATAEYREGRESAERLFKAYDVAPLSEQIALQKQIQLQAFRLRANRDRTTQLLFPPDRSATIELAQPRADELLFGCFPVRKDWACFAQNDQVLLTAHVEDLNPAASRDELSRALLAPFASQIRAARSIRVLAYGSMQQIDIHRLPWDGQPLDQTHTVVYALDLPPRSPLPKTDFDIYPRRAVVSGDPLGRFPQIRRASSEITRELQSRGWGVHSPRSRKFAKGNHLQGSSFAAGRVSRCCSHGAPVHHRKAPASAARD